MSEKSKKIIKNKRAILGSEIILWIARFMLLIIVAVGVTLIVSALYSYTLDVRKIEALALEKKLADCIASNGYLKMDFLKDKDFFLEKCKIIIGDEFFIKINITSFSNSNIFDFKFGENLEPLCKTTSKVKYMPTCLESKFYAISDSINQEKYVVDILVAIKKFNKL